MTIKMLPRHSQCGNASSSQFSRQRCRRRDKLLQIFLQRCKRRPGRCDVQRSDGDRIVFRWVWNRFGTHPPVVFRGPVVLQVWSWFLNNVGCWWIGSLLCQKFSKLFWTHALFGRFTIVARNLGVAFFCPKNVCKKIWTCFMKKILLFSLSQKNQTAF